MPSSPICSRGHLKTERPNGDLICRICHNAARDRRGYRGATGLAPQPAQPTDDRCIRGHKKVIRASGETACTWCEAARRRELRRLRREGECPHVATEAFDGVLSLSCRLVCLGCVAEGRAA